MSKPGLNGVRIAPRVFRTFTLHVIGILAFLAIGGFAGGGLASLCEPSPAAAWNSCDQRGYCGSTWYAGTISWHDSTGWTGAMASAIQSAGSEWHVGSSLDFIHDSSPTGPYQASIVLVSFGFLESPGRTFITWNSSDPHEIVGVATHLNENWFWFTDGTMNQTFGYADVRTVTLHEMGHWLYLTHDPNHTEAVMWPDFTQKWYRTTDDTTGLQVLYPW